MIPSLAGAAVTLVILLAGRLAGNAILSGLFISLAFGSTAIGAIPALGGSTPLIYTVFVGLLILSVALKRGFLRDLGLVFRLHWSAGIVVVLAIYAVISSVLMPRLFAGETSMFTPVDGLVIEGPLGPSSSNITQTAYFVLGVLAFFALRISLIKPENFVIVRNGFLIFACVHVGLGLIDLGGKFAGLGDVIAPIRTASYALLTEDIAGGFFRISGGFPEASSYSANSLACIAFAFTYWRSSGSKIAFGVSVALFALLLASTSTTAYVGLALLGVMAAAPIGVTFFSGRVKVRDAILFLIIVSVLAAGLALYIYDEKWFEPATELLRVMVFEKADSDSGRERAYWNYKGIQAFFDTEGLGVGFGSSRSSSWLISVVAQLGVIGVLMVGALLAGLLRGTGGLRGAEDNQEIHSLAAGARAMAVGWLTSISISGGAADPGLLFFLPLAVVLACRARLYGLWRERHTGANLLSYERDVPFLQDEAMLR